MPLILIYLIVALALFAFLQGIVSVFASRQEEETPSLKRRSLADGIVPWTGAIVRDFENLVVTNTKISPLTLLTGMAAGTIIIMMSTYIIWNVNPLFAFFGGIMVAFVLPLLYLIALRRRRLARLVAQLPEALDMLVRSLRVGHPVPGGIELVGKEMSDPIAGEFRRVFDSMSYGLDLKTALEQLAVRQPAPEIRYMVAAIRIQYATGGSLADVLFSLADVMRERVRLKAKVRALTAETRLSGNIMSLMPFLLIGGLLYLRPEFYNDVPESPVLQVIVGVTATLLVVGIILMRRVVNIRA